MEINHQSYIKIEEETQVIFREAGWDVELVANFERIEVIVNRAQIETVVRDTSTFLFTGFGAALTEMTSAFVGGNFNSDIDYRA